MVMPSPIAVIIGLSRIISDEDFFMNLTLTIFRGLSGYIIALVIGTIIGVIMGNNKMAYSYLQPIIQTLQAIPRVSWILLAMIWFPLNSIVVIFIMVITLFPLVVMNVYEGMQTVSKEYKEMSMVFKVSKFYMIKDLYFPSIIPFLLAASKIAAGITWKTILMAELLTVNSGIGFGMAFSKMALATDEIIAYTLIILVIGYMHLKVVDYITSKSKKYYI
jgi:NitT/TauT family transport system permease protein